MESQSPSTPQMEQFNIENPPQLYRNSLGDTDDENTSNDNIIFQNYVSSIDLGRKSDNELKVSICGIKGNSELSAILNVSVSAIGGGCFTFPCIIKKAGILLTLFIFLFVTFCIYYSIDLLRSFVVDTKYFSFALMTETILGSTWLKIYGVSSLITYLSMDVNYLSMIYNYIWTMIPSIGQNSLIRLLYFFLTYILEVFLCMYITKVAKMHLLSLICLSCFGIILLSVIIISIIYNINGTVKKKFTSAVFFYPKGEKSGGFFKFITCLSFFIEYVYGYSYHSTFPTLLGNMSKITGSTTKRVHIISFIIISVSYLLISYFGFLLHENVPEVLFDQEDPINLNDSANKDNFKKDYVLYPFKGVLCLFLLTLIPIRFLVVRDNYITLMDKKNVTFKKEFLITIVFLFLCNIIAYFLGFIKEKYGLLATLIQLFGGVFGVIIGFFLPVINYVAVNGKKKVKSIIGYAITFLFFVICGFSVGYSLYGMINFTNLFNDIKSIYSDI